MYWCDVLEDRIFSFSMFTKKIIKLSSVDLLENLIYRQAGRVKLKEVYVKSIEYYSFL